MTTPESLPSGPSGKALDPLTRFIRQTIERAGGWIGFDQFMAMALYTPGLGYYANTLPKFGTMPSSGSDFVTAPEMSPLFGEALAVQVGQALEASGTDTVWEFGAGSGALALQLLGALGDRVKHYNIVDLSGTLRERQQARLAAFAGKVNWLSELPEAIEGVVVGNEVLDAMPIKLLTRAAREKADSVWQERGVVATDTAFAWQDKPTTDTPPVDPPGPGEYTAETHKQAEAFIATLAGRLLKSERGGAAFFIDYGFSESEYYHPQRHMGTLMCHRAHQADTNPLVDVGLKDITAHVNFTGIALAGQDAGLSVLGYCSQARFLINCGLAERMGQVDVVARANAAKLIHEHEMGELFKVVGFATRDNWQALAFAQGDRSHTL